MVSTQGRKGAENLTAHRRKTNAAKALRLAQNKPKWKSEIYMDKEQYEAYIDSFLNQRPENVDGERIDVISGSQAKIAKGMYDTKCKYSQVSADVAAELDMEGFITDAKTTTEPDEPEPEEEIHPTVTE